MTRLALTMASLLPGALVLVSSGCDPAGRAAPAGSAAPAKVDRPVAEGDLARVTLTPEAETRLGIATAKVEKKSVGRTALHAGVVTVPPGRSIEVSAPLGGILSAPGNGETAAGARVRAGQPIFLLSPLWTERLRLAEALVRLESSRVEAAGEVEKARVEVEAARVALARSEQLLLDKAGSTRGVDDAKARLRLAEAGLKAAEARTEYLRKVSFEADGGSSKPIEIASPLEGIIVELHAARGQTVAQGAPLFEVASLDEIWVRVPVHAGDLRDVARDADAVVGSLSRLPGAPGLTARPVASAPPSADPLAATVDLHYGVEGSARSGLVPGERVGVTLSLKGGEDRLTVPWSSVLLDVHGGAWVYERVQPRTFVRRRVEVRFVSGGLAVLESGPPAGVEVVTEGAAELFGTELGFSK